MHQVELAPSILSADFTKLGDQVRQALDAGVRYVHVDVMDGHFVPNISIGPLIVRALRPLVSSYGALLDVHLMISDPDRYLEAFAEAGADITTVHVETCPHLHRTVQHIRDLGMQPGVTLNPATPLNTLFEILPYVDQVLIMSVNPGFGGQTYIPTSTAKVRGLRQMMALAGVQPRVEIDGGITPENAREVTGAGANMLVAGSAIFGGARTVAENIAAFRAALGH